MCGQSSASSSRKFVDPFCLRGLSGNHFCASRVTIPLLMGGEWPPGRPHPSASVSVPVEITGALAKRGLQDMNIIDVKQASAVVNNQVIYA